MEDRTDHAWSYLLKEKYTLKNVMLCLIKTLKIKYGIRVWYVHCNNDGKMWIHAGWGGT